MVKPHITIIPPFSPQYGFPAAHHRFNFNLTNDGTGDASVSVRENCPPLLTCYLTGFTSGIIPEKGHTITTLNVVPQYSILPRSYEVGIDVTYDDAYNFVEVLPNTTTSKISFIVRRARLWIESVYIENLTRIDDRWILIVQNSHEVRIKVNNSGNLAASNVLFIWNIPSGWIIENVEYSSIIEAGSSRIYRFRLTPTTIGNHTINFTINYTTTYLGNSLNYSEASSLFRLIIIDKPVFNKVFEGDMSNGIGLSGDLKQLSIFLNISFIKGTLKTVNNKCWLNCNPRVSNCDNAQSCTQSGLSEAVKNCRIFSPLYNTSVECEENGCVSGLNTIICYVSDSEFPTVGSWVNITFRHIAFDLFTPSQSAFTVGTAILPVYITNKGLLKDSYNISVISLTPNRIFVEPLQKLVENLFYGKTDVVRATLMILSEGTAHLSIVVNSTIDNRIYRTATTTIKSGYVSLSDLDNFSFLQITILAIVILFSIYFRRKK
ncbi:MAG: hypothetical protein RMJ17_00635 [Candidatus Aenigmarchaeota archaeon]|nr:hypothetical protein [Candidatus Aenigmarchaeota archaeon]MDW8149094.1 hypothetical protein [Candidatus Aenigmarchaeota archaeon]